MSLESSSIPSGAWQCWARQSSVWPPIGEYCIGWLLRQRNYWKLIWAVKAIIWWLRNNWQTGERREPTSGGGRVVRARGEERGAIITSSCNLHLQQTVCLLNEMQLDVSFIPSQSSELIEKRRVSLMNVFGSIQVIEPFTFFLPKNRTICMFFSCLMMFQMRGECAPSVRAFKGFDWTEIPFNIKVLEQLPSDTPHNHSFQIPGNDKRRGMNRKILPHCLLINLTETSKFDIYFAICGYYMKILYPLPNYCLWTNLLASQLRKNITTFFCFNKVKNAFCLYYF